MLDINLCFTYAYSLGTVADFYQTITGDDDSTNYIDLDAANLDIASGRPCYLIVRVGEAFVTMTSLDIKLETDTDPGFAVNLLDVQTWNILTENLTAGAVVVNQALPVQKYQRYVRIYWNVIGSSAGSGSTICAYLSTGPESAFAQLDLVDVA